MEVNNNNTSFIENCKDDKDSIVETYICDYLEVRKIIKMLPDNNEKDEIEIFYQNQSKSGIFRIKNSDFADINLVIKALNNNYVGFNPFKKNLIYDELLKQKMNIYNQNIIEYNHNTLGWYTYKDKKYFLYDIASFNDNLDSICIRTTGKFQNGNKEIYDKMLNEIIFKNNNMTMAFVLGFMGVVSSRIMEPKDLGNIIVGLTGKSSSGKTTALKLVASLWGNPSDTQGSLIMRNVGSENGLLAQSAGLFGVPILYDDLDTIKNFDVSRFIYNCSKGNQKVVSKTNGDIDYSRMGYSGIIIATAENPLLDGSTQRSGLYARTLDLSEISWSNNAKESESIKEITSQNYGFYGKKFGLFIQEITDETLLENYNQAEEIVKSLVHQKDCYSDRTIKPIIVMYETAKLLNECFEFNIDCEKICKIAIKADEDAIVNRDKVKLSYDTIIHWYETNLTHFTIKKDKQIIQNALCELYGQVRKNQNETHLYISTKKVDDVLKQNNLQQLTNYKKGWKERGYTKCEDGRYDVSEPSIMTGRCFHFVIKNNDDTQGDNNDK